MTDRPGSLRGKRILLGITGGVAAYKTPELVRALVKEGALVSVILTRYARRFVAPDALRAVTRGPVLTGLFEPAALSDGPWFPDSPKSELAYAHIGMAREADLVLIAPATANLIAKYANGLADDLLSTALTATRAPVLLAPAMNTAMWEHVAVQANVATLAGRGVALVGPEAGELADGETGMGRMAMLERIVNACVEALGTGKSRRGAASAAGAGGARAAMAPPERSLAGRSIVVTAGGTEEPIDPVRVISNRSSGKMGFAIAEEAHAMGADVTLIAAKTTAAAPPGIRRVEALTVAAMRDAVLEAMKSADALVMAAAVSDFTPAKPAKGKIPRAAAGLSLELKSTPDILKAVRERYPKKHLVGFALETEGGLARGREKLKKKGLDLIAVNNPLKRGSEFGSDQNDVTLIAAGGATTRLGLRPKREVAREILNRVAKALGRTRT
ncbi:MAG TPA: bifunctional phosphopantothenoylcysteine decarboxylase/phosphopantothenate--cysteine ligase CoaBC [Candidatus Eisenbacteria bacterium]|nr:bifunctional phosphopantothenoylcysteine decarboxylase/phosphopantothenate--cysteine ligase CoaBC [Candidatus Eisenbacteria bacterium]